MSSSNILFKPPVLLAAAVLIALVALSAGLRKQVDRPLHETHKDEQSEFDNMDTNATRITKIDAPSVSNRSRNKAPGAGKAQKHTPRGHVVEDFNTALRRADGNMYITGTIFGSDRSAQNENKKGADKNGHSWRERWDRTKPIKAAQVALYEDDPNTTHPALRTAMTDEKGSFTIKNINGANQRYIFVAKADNFAPEATYVSVNNEPRTVMMRLETGAPIHGKVLDGQTSQPVSGAVVYQPNTRWEAFAPLGVTTTTINGEFTFPNAHPGRLLTQARADGYAVTRARVQAPDDKSVIVMQPGGGVISGVTLDRLTGKPQGGARVWAKNHQGVSESVLSGADGTFAIKNLPEDSFNVYAVRGMKSEEQEIELEHNQTVADVQITLPAELLVSGQVVHAAKRQPLPGVKVWYKSSKGAQYQMTNTDGRFAFDTMAIDKYELLIHEKGFLPVNDKKGTDTETIVRKIASNQSSDEVTIRLKPVPTLEGTVTSEHNRGGWGNRGSNNRTASAGDASADGKKPAGPPVNDADLKLSYLSGHDYVQLSTKSDPAGNFFFNLPKGERGQGIVIANKNYSMDSKDVRVPRKKPIKLKLQRNFMFGSLLLVDESSLDGVPITVSTWLPKNHSDSQNAHRVQLSKTNSMRGGRVIMGLPKNQDVDLTFSMPDGVVVTKQFKTNKLLNSRPIFVYDPVSQDVVTDTSPRNSNRGNRRNGGNNTNGNNAGKGKKGNGKNNGQKKNTGNQAAKK